MIDLKTFDARRRELDRVLKRSDAFFAEFAALDEHVFTEGALSRRHKELTGLALAVADGGEASILIRLRRCVETGVSREEISEALKIAVMERGAATLPAARYVMDALHEMETQPIGG